MSVRITVGLCFVDIFPNLQGEAKM